MKSVSQNSRISINVENMPIFFFGHKKTKERIEKEIQESGKPLVIYEKVLAGGRVKKLSLSPSAAFGLPDGFDYDVITVLFYMLFEQKREIGICPYSVRLAFSDIIKLMQLDVKGATYQAIEKSIKKISSLDIYHEDFVKVRNEEGELVEFQENNLKLFHYAGIYKRETVGSKKNPMEKMYIDLDIPEWQRNNINNNYSTEYDINLYFSIGSRRAKRLYRLLDLIRWREHVSVPQKKIILDLKMEELPPKEIKRTIKKLLEELISIEFIKSYQLDDSYIHCEFTSLKKKQQVFKQKEYALDPYQLSLVDEIIEKLGDEHSRRWYEFLVGIVPEDVIYKCLSLTRESQEISGITKSKGAIFTDHIKRECGKNQIDLLVGV